jgi:hypothetical protein
MFDLYLEWPNEGKTIEEHRFPYRTYFWLSFSLVFASRLLHFNDVLCWKNTAMLKDKNRFENNQNTKGNIIILQFVEHKHDV